MSSEKKQRFLSKIFTVKHAGCCDMKIEEIHDASADDQEKTSHQNPAETVRRPARPCCSESASGSKSSHRSSSGEPDLGR